MFNRKIKNQISNIKQGGLLLLAFVESLAERILRLEKKAIQNDENVLFNLTQLLATSKNLTRVNSVVEIHTDSLLAILKEVQTLRMEVDELKGGGSTPPVASSVHFIRQPEPVERAA